MSPSTSPRSLFRFPLVAGLSSRRKVPGAADRLRALSPQRLSRSNSRAPTSLAAGSPTAVAGPRGDRPAMTTTTVKPSSIVQGAGEAGETARDPESGPVVDSTGQGREEGSQGHVIARRPRPQKVDVDVLK